MKKQFSKKKKDKIDYALISTLSDKINEYETELVEIHCSLSESIGDLGEYLAIQKQLDDLTVRFYSDKCCYEEIFEDLQNRFKRYEAILKNNSLFAICALFIPYIGFILGLTLESFNLIYLKRVNDSLKGIEDYSDQAQTKFNIIKKNIEIRYDALNKRLKEYADKQNQVKQDYDDDYTFHYANQILTSYLEGYDVAIDDIDSKILLALKCLLQQDLKTDCEDLFTLLSIAKETNLTKDSVKIKKL